MKSIFILIAFFISIHLGYAQTDSVTVEYSTDSVASKGYNTGRKYKYLDRNFIEEKQMTRLGSSVGYSDSQFFLEHERKLSVSSAINLGIVRRQYLKNSGISFFGYGIGYKYFYSEKKKIQKGTKISNLNGPYFSVNYAHNLPSRNEFFHSYENHILAFKWGIQKRLGRYGYFGIDTGVDFTPKSFRGLTDWFHINSQFKIGLAIGSITRSNTANTSYFDHINEKMNEITNQLKEDKTFLKLGLNDVQLDNFGFGIIGIFAFEQKLKPSFSIITESEYDLSYRFDNNPLYLSLSLNTGFRYYYSLQKRMKRGISANNFSANYFSIMALDIVSTKKYLITSQDILNSQNGSSIWNEKGIGLFWGMQRKIGKVGFVDFNIGYSYRKNSYPNNYTFNPEFRLIYGIGR